LPPVEIRASLLPPSSDSAPRMLVRSAQDCSERGQRGLILCERLSSRETSGPERQRAAGYLRGLLTLIRAAALALQHAPLAAVPPLAEQGVARVNPTRGQVVVPRGVVGLLASVVELGQGVEQLARFDVELHRIRLESAIER